MARRSACLRLTCDSCGARPLSRTSILGAYSEITDRICAAIHRFALLNRSLARYRLCVVTFKWNTARHFFLRLSGPTKKPWSSIRAAGCGGAAPPYFRFGPRRIELSNSRPGPVRLFAQILGGNLQTLAHSDARHGSRGFTSRHAAADLIGANSIAEHGSAVSGVGCHRNVVRVVFAGMLVG